MSHGPLDQFAEHLLASKRETTDYSREFMAAHEMPPTTMAKVHHLRAVLQARLTGDDSYELSGRRAEFGRVEFTDVELGERFLLKSAKAFAIEQQQEAFGQFALFPASEFQPGKVDLTIIVFDIGSTELAFYTAPAIEVGVKQKVRVIGQLESAGHWPLDEIIFDETTPFDQNTRDRFNELGAEDQDEEGSEDQ